MTLEARVIRRIVPLGVLLSGLSLFVTSADADRFVLKDGRRFEGEIVREVGDHLVAIRTNDGEIVTIDKRQIESQLEQDTPQDKYRRKVAELDTNNVDAQRALAAWCKENGLEAESTRHMRKVVELAPYDESAREALGYVLIGGDWFLEGSDEAAERRAQIEQLTQMPRPIPDDFEIVDLSGNGTGAIVRGGGAPGSVPSGPVKGSVQLVVDERVGSRAPEHSHAAWRLAPILRSLDEPLGVRPTESDAIRDGMVMEVKVRVYFVRTHMFYGRIPVSNVFKGEASGTLYEVVDGKKKVVSRLPAFTVPFSASVQNTKDRAYEYAYQATMEEFGMKFSRWDWARKRGAKPVALDDI